MFGLRLGKLGAAIKAGTGSAGVVPLFSRDYTQGTLGANATFARSSSATIVDHEGVIRTVPSGAARFNGLRYVRNLFTNTTTSLASGSSTTAVTVTAGSYIFSMGAGSGTATFSGTATGSTGTLSANASNRTAKTLTITAGGTIIVTASVAALATIQLENATGRTDTTTPSEYVSVGVLPAPYHGANVDGIKYFATENGNSVVSNVVTEGTGAAITGGYLLMEPAATNQQIHANNFASDSLLRGGTGSATPIRTIAYADGPLGALSATRFQFNRGTDATGYSQAFCLSSGFSSGTNYVASIWMKSLSGSVTIGVWASGQQFETVNGGNAGLSVHSVGEEWVRINSNGASTGTAGNSGSVSFGLVGSYYIGGQLMCSQTADVLVCARMIEPGTTPTSYIPTSDSAVTRAAESLSYSGIAADNETRAITDAGTVDVDDWDGIVDATINGADNLAQITSIDVYTTGERPA